MHYFLGIVSGLIISFSGTVYDSDFVSAQAIPAPMLFIALWLFVISLMLIASRGKVFLFNESKIVFLCAIALIIIGSVPSFFSGAGNWLAYGMKVSMVSLNAALFVLSMQLWGGSYFRWLSYSSFSLSVLVIIATFIFGFENLGLNKNWVGITATFTMILFFLSANFKRSTYLLALLLVAAFAFFEINSRGVGFAALLGAIVLPLAKLRVTQYAVFSLLPLVSIGLAFFGVWLYNSVWYGVLNSWSLDWFGSSLDSSRLERWNLAAGLFSERPVLGWGLDAHLVRASSLSGFGDIHNLWWEFLFRTGFFGLILLLIPVYVISFRLLSSKDNTKAAVIFLIIFVFVSVYALGGVTHWPGAFLTWVTFGVLVADSRISEQAMRIDHVKDGGGE